jgi:hypothetical protein
MEERENNSCEESQKSGIHAIELLLTPEDVALQFRFKLGSLANWRSAGIGPAYIKVGGAVRYTRKAIEDFLVERSVKPCVREEAEAHDLQKRQPMALQTASRRKAV